MPLPRLLAWILLIAASGMGMLCLPVIGTALISANFADWGFAIGVLLYWADIVLAAWLSLRVYANAGGLGSATGTAMLRILTVLAYLPSLGITCFFAAELQHGLDWAFPYYVVLLLGLLLLCANLAAVVHFSLTNRLPRPDLRNELNLLAELDAKIKKPRPTLAHIPLKQADRSTGLPDEEIGGDWDQGRKPPGTSQR